MKKLIISIAICLVGMVVQGQYYSNYTTTSVRALSETVGFWTISADTMDITFDDNVVAGFIIVPSYATDSVTISGCTFTIDGMTTNDIKVPPGGPPVPLGFNYALSDSLSIACPDVGLVMLFIDRN